MTETPLLLHVKDIASGDYFRVSTKRLVTSGTVRRVLRTNVEYEGIYEVGNVREVYVLKIRKTDLVGAALARDGQLYEVIT